MLLANLPGGEQALNLHLTRPRYQPAFTRVARWAGKLVGAAYIRHGRIRIGPATLDVGLFQPLFLHDLAHQPAMIEALIGDVLTVLAENSLPVALLPLAQARLSEFGFVPFQQLFFTAGWQAADSRADLRPLTAADLDDCAALYTETYRQLPLSEVRTAPDWRFWFAAQDTTYALVDARGRLVAYACGANTTVNELAAADAGAARALLHCLPAYTLMLPFAHQATQVALWMGARLTAQLAPRLATNAGLTFSLTLRPALAGIVDMRLGFEQLAPVFAARLANSRYADWHGSIQIESGSEPVVVRIDAGQSTVSAGAATADLRLRRVTLPGLAQLCLGARAVADLRASGELDCDDTALGLLDSLFPVLIGC